MKLLKKILIVCSFCALLTTTNCFAVTLEDTKISEDKCYKEYKVNETEKDAFIKMLDEEIEIEGVKYKLIDKTFTGGNTIEEKEIKTTKTILSDSNKQADIVKVLGDSLHYEEDGYVGEYKLDIDSLKIVTNYNGYKEVIVDQTIIKTGIEKNDLDYIEKQITKNGLKLDLLKVDWEVETTKMIGEYEVPNTYKASCYYATKQRIDYPNTYTVTGTFKGKATKTNEIPLTYTLEYQKVEEKDYTLAILGSTAGVGLIILFFLSKNVTVYNYRDGKFKKVGKVRARNGIIKLNRFYLAEQTNKYKLVLSKSLTNKLRGSLVTVKKNTNSVKLLVNTNNDTFSFEVRI